MGHYRVKNFEKFQHYKDRNPPWIKLYYEMLDDYEFNRLQDASKLHLVLIWLLASRYSNRIPDDPAWIAKRINATEPIDFNALISSGFLEHYDGASKSLASCEQNAMPETETEKRDIPRARPEEFDTSADTSGLPTEAALEAFEQWSNVSRGFPVKTTENEHKPIERLVHALAQESPIVRGKEQIRRHLLIPQAVAVLMKRDAEFKKPAYACATVKNELDEWAAKGVPGSTPRKSTGPPGREPPKATPSGEWQSKEYCPG